MMKASSTLGSLALLALAACGSGGGGNTGGTGGQTTMLPPTLTGGAGGAPVIVNCNPFTAAGCDLDKGQSCDFDGAAFSCFDAPNDVALCGACGSAVGHYCGVGMTCLDSNECARFCCSDGDCGPGGACRLDFLGDPNVGVCAASTLMDAGLGGAGGGSGTTVPACSAPATPPSMGACYMP